MEKLSNELREQYRKKVAEKGRDWVIVPAFLIGFVLAIEVLVTITGGGGGGLAGFLSVMTAAVLAAVAAHYFWVAYRKKIVAAWPDDLLEHNYQEFQQQKHRVRVWSVIAGVAAIVLLATVAANNPAATALFFSGATCNVVSADTRAVPFFTNGAPDAGYEIDTLIRNTGSSGMVRIDAILSTTEGDIEKTRDLQLEAGESRVASFEFPEPTINASNVSEKVTCRP